MESSFKVWTVNRNILLGYFDKFSLEQLNTIPKGFNNNLIWNLGHIMVVQQGLVYRASGLPMNISDELFARFKTGSKPTGDDTQEMADLIKGHLTLLMNETKKDYMNGAFTTYKEINTSTGFNLASVSDAIAFNNYHEGLHAGIMMALSKLV